jgi:hypothetical protein
MINAFAQLLDRRQDVLSRDSFGNGHVSNDGRAGLTTLVADKRQHRMGDFLSQPILALK